MRLETDLRDYLLGQPSITDLVSDRIFGLLREPQAALPALMIQRIHTERQELFCGVAPLAMANMQIDSYAMNGDDAWTLGRALRILLKNFSGSMGPSVIDTVFLTNEFPMVDPDPGIMRVLQIYNFWYVED